MEVIAGVASVAQLASQAVDIVQKIQAARNRVRDAPKVLKELNDRLDRLLRYIALVREHRELQTPEIRKVLEDIVGKSSDLRALVERLSERSSGNRVARCGRALVSGSEVEREMSTLLNGLDVAKDDLRANIALAHVSVTSDLRSGLIAALPTLTDERYTIESPRVALEPPGSASPSGMASSPPLVAETPHGKIVSSRRDYKPTVLDSGRQVNGDIGSADWKAAGPIQDREFHEALSRGTGLQVNGDMDADAFSKMLANTRT